MKAVSITLNGDTWEDIEADLARMGYQKAVVVAEAQAVADLLGKTASEASGGEAPTQTATEAAKEPPKKRTTKKSEPVASAPAVEQAAAAQAETAEQDAADEAAETSGAPLSIDDLRLAMTGYARKFGNETAAMDRGAIFAAGLGDPPKGSDVWSIKHFTPGDANYRENAQELLADAIKAWKEATEKNPFKREPIE